ncbi:MAG TPA: diguanylate cyclase [Arenimonas sp.]|nr:diguanylate cyclase [Arenimonas sp.]
MSPTRLVCVVFVLLLAAGWSPARAQSLRLDASRPVVELSAHLSYLHEPDATASAATMLLAARQDRFAPLPEGRTTFGFGHGAYWFHARLFNDSTRDERWLLVLSYPLLDYVDVHLRHPNGQWIHLASGDHLPFSSRGLSYRHPNFWLDLPQRTEVDLLVRVSSSSSTQVPLTLYTASAFAEMERQAQFGLGLYNGILLALFLYNLVLWLASRDSSHFWYTVHVGAFGLLMLCLNGLAFEYFWPDVPALANQAIPLTMALGQVAMHQFTRVFLELRKRWRVGDLMSRAMIALLLLLALLSPLLDYRDSVVPLTLLVFPGAALILWQTVRCLLQGFKPARLFLVAWSMLLLGTSIYALISLGMVPKVFVTEYGIQIGSALEMVLLSFALAYRYAALRNESERIIREANEQLERSVARRTTELSSALEQLADANSRLRESNRRDALTGAFNRRHFREVFEQLLRQSQEQRRQLGVVLVDLDHFKAVNDQHGHLAGDDCLRHLSRLLHDELRSTPGAVLSRFGGEEFAVLLPDQPPTAVAAIAEAMRRRLAETPATHGDLTIPMSASFGAYNIEPGVTIRADDALHRADHALYAAKTRGRNCVQVETDLPQGRTI